MLILVGSPDDDLIRPWDSAFFNYYKGINDGDVEQMENRTIYKENLFGLKTLNEAGKIVKIIATGFDHPMYMYEKCQPWMIENVYKYLGNEF